MDAIPSSTHRNLTLASAGAIVLAACIAASPPAGAQAFPSKPVRMVVPTSPGGNVDIVARLAAEGMGRGLGQPVVVENLPGGRHIPASLMVSKSNPDGYTLLQAGSVMSVNATLYKLPFDPLRDFAPVGMIGSTPPLLVAWPGLEANNISGLVALAKAKPDSIHYASAGPGSPAHLGGELLNSMAGIKLVHVSYKATAQGNTDTIAGRVQLSFPAASSVLPFLKSGRLKALGISSSKRSPQMPDVATIAETLPGYEMNIWNSVITTAGVPRPIINRLNEALTRGINLPDVKARLIGSGLDVEPSTPEALGAYFDSEIRKWNKLIRERGIKAEDD